MASSRAVKKRAGKKPLMMGGIPINRFYSYENTFFKNRLPVLQGITFPLKRKSFEGGHIRLAGDAEPLGAARRGMDVRNISYALAYGLD